MRGRVPLKIVLAAVFGGLAFPSAAAAVPLTVPFIGFGGPPPTTSSPPGATIIAGDEEAYTIAFVAGANGLSGASSAVIINAAGAPPLASGTIFPASALHDEEGAVYTIGTADDPQNVVVADVIRQNGNQTVIIPIAFTGLAASPGEVVTVGIGYPPGEHKVRNRPTACDDCRLVVDTTMAGDDFGPTPAFDVVIGPGDLFVCEPAVHASCTTSGDNQNADVGTAFGSVLRVRLVNGTGAPVQGATVTFTAPANGPSGTFTDGGGLSDDAVTDANGVATSSVLTANGEVGAWTVEADSDVAGVNSVEFNLENDAGPADAVDLVLNPDQIQGDGVSRSTATATVEDSFGNPVDENQSVSFSSDSGNPVSATEQLSASIYRARITSTPQPDVVEITVNVAGGPSDSAFLLQTPDNTAPGTRIIDHPKKRTRARRATFTFEATRADVDFFECKLDGGSYQVCTSPKSYRVRRGRHTFSVRATDFAGNTGAPDSFTWKRIRKRR